MIENDEGRPVKRHASGSPRPVTEPVDFSDETWRCVKCGEEEGGCDHLFGLYRLSDPDNWKLPPDRRPDPEAPLLTEDETNELVERINANPNLHPLPTAEAVMLREALIEAKLARLNWQKYNTEKGDEIVYQAEKMATAIDKIIAALNPSPVLVSDEEDKE